LTWAKSPQVIVASDEASPTVSSLVECVASLGGEAHVLSTRRLPRDGCVSFDADGAEVRLGEDLIRLDACRGIWNWHADPPLASDDDEATARYVRREWELTVRGLAAASPESIWVNHPLRAGWLDGNKLAQMSLAARAGFEVPPTLLSNDPDRIVRFARQFDHVAVKSQGGAWREMPDGAMAVAYTQRCTSAELDAGRAGLTRAPVLVQPYLEKTHELRVTVVDAIVFVCRIDSQASARTEVDWRRDVNAVSHELVDAAPGEVDRLRELVHAAGLRYAAIDLACTHDGKKYFLDLNPAGQFGWIEARTGAPILRTLAEALLRPA
jgi:glutathione synthase/RimK-type ligase-like ATP-grasp enzyme